MQAEIVIGEDEAFYERRDNGEKGKKLKKAEITLNDCLACSFVSLLPLYFLAPADTVRSQWLHHFCRVGAGLATIA